ncbi:hypothetical protein ZIOFF_031609 [Zingiber officinale]|uniref:non-specific serine/threonine protein kinase n=1 Tax=Zingiber officinale TaxID=94328 RepID=A0A8J5LAY0_ZINOF|nr:hypothetical protein ZIOFF_031609 [Zingiber officinale]
MTAPVLFVVFFPLTLLLLPYPTALSQSSSAACQLDFSVINRFVTASSFSSLSGADAQTRCNFILQSLHLVFAQYLLTNSLFHASLATAPACWDDFEAALSPLFPAAPFDVRAGCGFRTDWIAQGCMNLTSRGDFEDRVPRSAIAEIGSYCNQSLHSSLVCVACTASLNRFKAAYLPGPDYGNVSDCNSYPFIYSAAAISGGPSSVDNAYCYFNLSANSTSSPPHSGGGRGAGSSIWIYVVCILLLLLLVFASLIWIRRRRSLRRTPPTPAETRPSRALESISASTTLIKFTYEEIQLATRNFSRDNVIGRGGYGNVFKGVLADGTKVALKRFKNCSASGDTSFAHEVEVIASVRHVNLLALRGYCIATTQMEGHQRIIVCDLMQNGSLHDHLFATEDHRRRLSWPLRQKIAVGTARGLAYLHTGAQPLIIHRDIKASNILLDENFEPKVADFGLAKFTPEGMSHVSTKVAGTLGYVAPEYALYGQLSEKSDVFSFGVLLLELLSGKKAFGSRSDGQAFVVSDWAWSLARRGRALDVIEEGMDELGPREVLEKYVHVAVLCTHHQFHARPAMDQVLKILETDLAMPATDRTFPILSHTENTETSSESGLLSSSPGYRSFTFGKDDTSNDSGIVSESLPGNIWAGLKGVGRVSARKSFKVTLGINKTPENTGEPSPYRNCGLIQALKRRHKDVKQRNNDSARWSITLQWNHTLPLLNTFLQVFLSINYHRTIKPETIKEFG